MTSRFLFSNSTGIGIQAVHIVITSLIIVT